MGDAYARSKSPQPTPALFRFSRSQWLSGESARIASGMGSHAADMYQSMEWWVKPTTGILIVSANEIKRLSASAPCVQSAQQAVPLRICAHYLHEFLCYMILVVPTNSERISISGIDNQLVYLDNIIHWQKESDEYPSLCPSAQVTLTCTLPSMWLLGSSSTISP